MGDTSPCWFADDKGHDGAVPPSQIASWDDESVEEFDFVVVLEELMWGDWEAVGLVGWWDQGKGPDLVHLQ